jgi:hypothetical protein
MRHLFRHDTYRLLIPLLVFNGFEQGFVYSDYTKVNKRISRTHLTNYEIRNCLDNGKTLHNFVQAIVYWLSNVLVRVIRELQTSYDLCSLSILIGLALRIVYIYEAYEKISRRILFLFQFILAVIALNVSLCDLQALQYNTMLV